MLNGEVCYALDRGRSNECFRVMMGSANAPLRTSD
jgi:hypothetical protein